MKNCLFLLISILSSQMVSSQNVTTASDNVVYNTSGITVKPEFPGGVGEFYKYIAKNYRTPYVKKLNGKVFVSFVIEMDGSINEIKILKDIGYGTGDEAIRVLSNSPAWSPGEQDGRKVRCSYALPILIDTR